jgi:hypothetical protein
MRYESTVNSTGGDDVALAKSFIIACVGPVLNWYSLLPPHSVCSWVDLKTKFMQAFQMFHDTTAESSDLYNCKQKDREPLRNFVRRFMQQRSQIPEADDKTTIKALIKGLTPGPTASHLTRKKPKTVEEIFNELKEYILSDDDHRKRVAERNEARQGHREMNWRPQFIIHETSTTWKILSLTRTTDQAQEEDSYLGEGGEEEDPRDSRITTQGTRTSIVSIMEEDTTLKGARNQEEHRKNSTRESFDEHRILNAEPTSPEFLAAKVHELSTKSSRNAAISTTTTIMATLSAIFPSVAGNPINPATTANSRNLATTT